MKELLEEKLLLLQELYDATYVLKQAIETHNYERIEKMVTEREFIISQIDQLKIDKMDPSESGEIQDQIQEILLRIKAIDDFNISGMPKVLRYLETLINEGKRKQSEIDKVKSAYNKYQGASLYQHGTRLDIRK